MLRPETLESLYYLYWITREDIYRDQAWEIFEAFEEHCRVDRGGYAGLVDVTDVSPHRNNYQYLPPKIDRLFWFSWRKAKHKLVLHMNLFSY